MNFPLNFSFANRFARPTKGNQIIGRNMCKFEWQIVSGVTVLMKTFVRRLETSAPTLTQPQSTTNDGWRKTTLSVPGKIVTEDVVKDGGPIAPPRKKRLSMIPPEQPCGFKELFGNNVSRRSSCDSVLKDNDALQQKRMSDSNVTQNAGETEVKVPLPLPESETSAIAAAAAAANLPPKTAHRLQRKISRVGNKKSDKFFGENLSDCLSDEPVTPEPPTDNVPAKDELDHFIDAIISAQGTASVSASAQKVNSAATTAVDDDEENKTSLDRKAEFLMAMLDDKNLYNDANGGDDEVIVPPKRKHSKSASPPKSDDEPIVIAKDETKVAAEAKHDESKVIKKLTSVDDTDYYKNMTPVDEPIIVPQRRQPKPHICDDDDHLHHHVQKSEKIEQAKVDAKREVSVADIIEQIITPKKPKRDFTVYEKTIVQTESTPVQSHLEAAKVKPIPRVRHLSQGNLMSPKRPSTTIDLSVTATAVDAVKLKNAPDSPNPLESALKKCMSQQSFLTEGMMCQIVDRVYGFKDPVDDLDSYDDGSSKVSPHSKLTTRKISVARKDPLTVAPIHENPSEEKSNESMRMENINVGPVAVIHTIELSSPSSTVSNTESTVNFLNLERMYSNVPNKNPEQTPAPANSIESINATFDTINSISRIPSIEGTVIETVNIDDSSSNKHVLDDIYSSNRSILDGFQRYLDTEKKSPSIATTESSTIGSSDDENTDSDITVKEINANNIAKNLTDIDVRAKFLNAKDSGERRDSIVEVDQWFLKHNHQSFGTDTRRDSNSSIGYDTRKVFPFGKAEPGAGTEFFESQSIVDKNENISTNNEPTTQNNETIEHSALLKYLK